MLNGWRRKRRTASSSSRPPSLFVVSISRDTQRERFLSRLFKNERRAPFAFRVYDTLGFKTFRFVPRELSFWTFLRAKEKLHTASS